MIKKYLMGLIAIVLFFSFTACGNSDSGSSPSGQTGSNNEANPGDDAANNTEVDDPNGVQKEKPLTR